MNKSPHAPLIGNAIGEELRSILEERRGERRITEACEPEVDRHDACVAPWCECTDGEHPQQGHGAWLE